MKKLLYMPLWFFKARILGKHQPLQSVVFISEQCNLACRHCCVYNQEHPRINTFEAIRQDLEYCYNLGSRFVDFEGGEPFIWQDASDSSDIKDINSLFRLAREIGFFTVTVTTNAQIDFSHCEADSIWVSLDGLGDYHDAIRGEGAFDNLLRNIDNNSHSALSVNMVINSLNYPSVRETIEFVKNHKNIKSISINFHTPYSGTEELALDWDIRRKIIDEVISMKKQGYPLMNSISGLKLMKSNDFKKYCWVSNFVMVDHTKYAECHGSAAGMCEQCGFCMAGEMHSVMNLKLDTIFAGLKLRIG